MQNTSESYLYSAWIDQQKALIASLRSQPLVVVLRPKEIYFELPYSKNPLFLLIEKFSAEGVKHIEIAWSSHPAWMSLIDEVRLCFSNISLGAASITTSNAVSAIAELDLEYAMTPIWSSALQMQARSLKQLLVPGVCSPTEVHAAKSFGCQLIKLFPANTLGIEYIDHLKGPIGSLPFVIAAGGLTIEDLDLWLKQGYGAIAIGRGLTQNQQVGQQLKQWLKTRT